MLGYRPLAIASLALAAACGRDPLAPQDEALRGSWAWVRACCGFTGLAQTPETEGVQYTFHFGAGRRALIFRNDSLLVPTTYALASGRSDDETRLQFAADVPGGRERLIAELSDTVLVLRSECRDCYGRWRFRRMR